MNLPNKITLSRIALIPIFLLFVSPIPDFLYQVSWLGGILDFISKYGDLVGVVIFAIASLTDGIDGYIARKNNLVTNLGIFLDPIADKLLVMSALLALLVKNKIGILVVVIVLSREFIVTAFRLVASSESIVISANILGKSKTMLQMIFIIYMFIKGYVPFIDSNIVVIILTVLVMISTIYSGWDYIYSNKEVLKKQS